MRIALSALVLLAAFACGGRATLGDESAEDGGARSLVGGASSGGAPSSGGSLPTFGGNLTTFGGASTFGGNLTTFGGATSPSGGRSSPSGGRPNSGGRPGRGGATSSGGVTVEAGAAGAPTAGAGGDTSCFSAVQGGVDYCIKVDLCATSQRETLCSLTNAIATVTCTCFLDGRPIRGQSFFLGPGSSLCGLAISFECNAK